MTKAQEVYEKVNTLIEGGAERPDAFKQLATEYGQPVNTIRGSYYIFIRGELPVTAKLAPVNGETTQRMRLPMPALPSNAQSRR